MWSKDGIRVRTASHRSHYRPERPYATTCSPTRSRESQLPGSRGLRHRSGGRSVACQHRGSRNTAHLQPAPRIQPERRSRRSAPATTVRSGIRGTRWNAGAKLCPCPGLLCAAPRPQWLRVDMTKAEIGFHPKQNLRTHRFFWCLHTAWGTVELAADRGVVNRDSALQFRSVACPRCGPSDTGRPRVGAMPS